MKTKQVILLMACCSLNTAAIATYADSITVDGVTYTDVLIQQSPSLYYVQLPDHGRVLTVAKDAVDPGTIVYTVDETERAALEARWKAAREPQAMLETQAPALAPQAPASRQAALAPQPAGMPGLAGAARQPIVIRDPGRVQGAAGAPQNEYVTDGMVPYVNLKNVPLKDALKATLRPLGLDYEVNENHIFISTPERLRTTSTESMETRYYDLRGGMAETMPKIVLRNPGGYNAQLGGGFGGGGFGGQGGFGGGQGGFGGGQGGFGGGQGGFGGGQGGFGGGRGGFGGGQGGIGAGSFSNISELFFTIDDRLVGEPPAIIGMGGMTAVGGAGAVGGGVGGVGGGAVGGLGVGGFGGARGR